MILNDASIRRLLPSILPKPEHQDPALINPASLDIRLGEQVIMEGRDGGTLTVSLRDAKVTKEDGSIESGLLMIHPGQFFLVETLEFIALPPDLACDLRLKSSRAREGYNHSLAFWIDPGWEGRLTMEIQNITQHRPLPLRFGMRFAQLIFYMLNEPAERPYAGRYKGAESVQSSRGGSGDSNIQGGLNGIAGYVGGGGGHIGSTNLCWACRRSFIPGSMIVSRAGCLFHPECEPKP